LTGFEFAAGRGGWEGLEKFDPSLAIDNTLVVELGDTRDLNGFVGLVVVDYFLGVLLESCEGLIIGATYPSDRTYEG
jgi:hypothetical protein